MNLSDLQRFHFAAKIGDLDTLQILLTPQILNQRQERVSHKQMGLTALLHSILSVKYESSMFLLGKGADPNQGDFQGDSPLHHSADNSILKQAKLLLNNRADPNKGNLEGETPLHNAAYRGDSEMIQLLLFYGADPNIQCTTWGRTPLHSAVIGNYIDCIQALIQKKADLFIRDYQGESPYDLATGQTKEKLVAFSQKVMFLSIVQEVNTQSDCRSMKSVQNSNKMTVSVSFQELDFSNLLEDMDEPDRETFASEEKEHIQLLVFLKENKLEQYYQKLIEAGFDDLESMVQQMKTPFPIDEKMLQELGVEKSGHRRRLLVKLLKQKEERIMTEPYVISTMWCECEREEVNLPNYIFYDNDLKQWLTDLKLDELYENFIEAGYDDLNFIREMMSSEFPLTQAILQNDIGVRKSGHRIRILGRILGEIRPIEHEFQLKNETFCKICSIF